MGLQVERVDPKGRMVPVADYVTLEWREWLQRNRVELNAMETPAFLDWLDGKMAKRGGKLIPPGRVLYARLAAEVKGRLRQTIIDQAVREAKVDQRTKAAYRKLKPSLVTMNGELTKIVKADLRKAPEHPWTAPVADVAARLAGG
jgi:hypothetical protein